VSQLRYLHAVSLEVLRLHPSVAKDIKWAVDDDTWPDGTQVPAGAAVVYCPFAMGRDPRKWTEPLAFRPERFLGEEGGVGVGVGVGVGGGGAQHEPSMWEYPVFNAGPRLCLGKPLAMMEIKLITATLLHHFDFELAEPHLGGYLSTIVLPMDPGLKVNLTPRHCEAYPVREQ
jgi:cytochrome P450